MAKLFRTYMKGAYLMALFGPICMAFEVIADILQPAYMENIIDVGVASGNVAYILSRGRWMLLWAIIGYLGGAGNNVFSNYAAERFAANLRDGLFRQVQRLSFREIDRFTASSLITRLTNDVTQMQNLVQMVLRTMFRAPLLCIGGVIASYMMSPRMSLIFICAIPILLIAVLIITKLAFPLFAESQKKLDRINTVMRESLLGVRVIKAFAGQGRERERFEGANEDFMAWSLKSSYLTITLTPISTFVMNASIIALFWYGGNMAIDGRLETGAVMALMTYFMQVLNTFVQVVMTMISISRAMASFERIDEVLAADPSIKEPENPAYPADSSVEFSHVCFRYAEEDEGYILRDIDFRIGAGETLGIIGATGSGKSSLAMLIPRLYDADEGQVKVGGVDVRDIARETLSGYVGMVLQESSLFSGTIEENLRWGAGDDAPADALEAAARDAEALGFILAKEDGFGAVLEQRGQNFSGGQKQRLSIARTLARNPKILILDDSTSALDTETDAKIRAAIGRLPDATTVIIIAQRISAIMHSDRILVLDGGEVSGLGTHAELMKANEIYRAIAKSQLGEDINSHA